jgi:SSS family solute:Na+ symporter
MPLYAASVIKGGANFVETYFGIDYSVALLAFVSIVAIYVWMGGMKGVMYTDAFQGSIMFVSMVTLLIIAYTKLGGITAAHRSLDQLFSNPDIQKDIAGSISKGFQGWLSMPKTGSPNWWNLVTAIVTGVGIGVLTQPQLIVRFMSVKSNRELNRAVLSGGVFILAMTGIAFVVGALSNVLLFNKMGKISIAAAGGVVDKIIPLFISTYIPDWFGAIFLIPMLAAAMSTLSSQFHAMGTAIGRDVYERAFRGKGKTIFINKVGILVVILISTVLAYLTKHMSASDAIIAKGTTIFFELTTAVFLPAYLGALYFKKMPRAAVIAGMISGFVTWFFWNFFVHSNAASLQLCKLLTGKTSLVADIPSLSNLMMVGTTYIALPVSILVTGLVWLVFALNRKKDLDDAHVQKCFEGL